MSNRISVTVAAVIERDGRFLVVEEEADGGVRINQPAGHLEPGETLLDAVSRETLEETAYGFVARHLLGVYRWRHPASGVTYVRFAFLGEATGPEPGRDLDAGILRALWLAPQALRAQPERHRSPLVLRCVEDCLAGQRYPLDLLIDFPGSRLVTRKRVVVGMSGGVDSSVAAWLLKEQGFDVQGLFMKNWEDDDTDEYCTSRADLVDAVSVAELIGIDIEAVNFSSEYRERVFNNFLAEYRAGRTPNPDVLCNAEIKFRAFLDHALDLGADWIATGHYARVREVDGRFELLRALDPAKDQSYFLYRLDQTQLSRTLFPLGAMLKRDVRALAQRIGLPNHAKRDSTGICFIGERPFREFLMRYLPTAPGPMETPDGRQVGTHDGLMYYTIGQRHGLGVGGPGEAWYVADKQLERNCLVVVQGHEHPALFKAALYAEQLSWVAAAPAAPAAYAAKTRYRQADAPCILGVLEAGGCEVAFESPQWAVTPGQSVVVYEGSVCLGGGIIR